MNQTQKRLSIIKLAISINETDVIQIEIPKLLVLQSDIKIQEIVALLQKEKYGQAQDLIIKYLDSPKEIKIVQRNIEKEVEEDELLENLEEQRFKYKMIPYIQNEDIKQEAKQEAKKDELLENLEEQKFEYKMIPYIQEKLLNMNKLYPPINKINIKLSGIEDIIKQIKEVGYSEDQVSKSQSYIKKLLLKSQEAEASQYILLFGATESHFGQLILARELYKGRLFQQNISQVFEITNRLAMEDYPNAICDLGQFYENAIGTKKDIKKAEHYYKEAMKLGIRRANKHYFRLNKYNNRFFKRFW